jgi:hypothetical protein
VGHTAHFRLKSLISLLFGSNLFRFFIILNVKQLLNLLTMKKKIYSILPVIVLLVLIAGCEERTDPDPERSADITGEIADFSDCKLFEKSALCDEETPDTLSCIYYEYDALNNRLTVRHINAGFNCCPDSLYCEVSVKNDTIVIQEYEKVAQCYCNCLYDLTIELDNIELKTYYLSFIEPYRGEQERIVFAIDLSAGSEGSYCVTRKSYPWGLFDYNQDPVAEISGELVSHTGCKGAEDILKNDVPDTTSCIIYTYNPVTGELSLKHVNAGFNCCPGTLYCTVSQQQDTICLQEYETESMCDCNCLFDLDIKLTDVQPAKYYLKIIEPYAADEEKLYFGLDLQNDHSGSYCVNRNHYPWIEI